MGCSSSSAAAGAVEAASDAEAQVQSRADIVLTLTAQHQEDLAQRDATIAQQAEEMRRLQATIDELRGKAAEDAATIARLRADLAAAAAREPSGGSRPSVLGWLFGGASAAGGDGGAPAPAAPAAADTCGDAALAQPAPQAEAGPPSAPAARRRGSLLAEGPLPAFEMSTPMLVMPFLTFKEQGRIFKSVQSWRDKALAAGSLVVHAKVERGTGKIVEGKLDGRLVVEEGQVAIFLSHTWWDRAFVDASNDPNDPYDKGAPDYQTGEKKNFKFQVICAGVKALIRQKGLNEEDVTLWVDWQSIYQDDKEEKLKGVIRLGLKLE